MNVGIEAQGKHETNRMRVSNSDMTPKHYRLYLSRHY